MAKIIYTYSDGTVTSNSNYNPDFQNECSDTDCCKLYHRDSDGKHDVRVHPSGDLVTSTGKVVNNRISRIKYE